MSVESARFFPALAPRFSRLLARLAGCRVAVLGHQRPDGDCIGSQIALARLLAQRGIEAVCANPDAVPRRLAYLVGDTPFFRAVDLPPGDWEAVLVDCADLGRTGKTLGERFPRPLACIDHHLSNDHGAEENLVDSAAAATAEMIAGLAFDLGLPVDAPIARALYAGILTDTGQFRFAATSRRVFELAGRLLDCGADPVEAGFRIYECETFGRMKLLQRFLASLELECGGRVCVGTLPLGVFEETGATSEDTEGLVDYARAVDGVEVGVLLEAREGGTKGSLRGRDPALRLDLVAAQFGGGGHACAAGLNTARSVHEVRAELLAVIAERLSSVSVLPAP